MKIQKLAVILLLLGAPVFAVGGAQAQWLEKDLKRAVANREKVPWIVVGSHFPLYSGRFEEEGAANASLSWCTLQSQTVINPISVPNSLGFVTISLHFSR